MYNSCIADRFGGGSAQQLNIQQMRYVLEVEKTGSISQAAENLFMGQPNLSKAIKDLELSLGIRIFKRTPRGVSVTASGQQFLEEIKRIIKQIEDVEARYGSGQNTVQNLSVSVPHCWYFSSAFASFVQELDPRQRMELCFNETDSLCTINNVAEEGCHIGIIRYHVGCETYFLQLLASHNLQYKMIREFESLVLLSRTHPLANNESLDASDLEQYIEISHGGCAITGQPNNARCRACRTDSLKKIHVQERGSQLDLLANNPHTYMWTAFMPADVLVRYGLVQKTCNSGCDRCRDMLIYPHGYVISAPENRFLEKLYRQIEQVDASRAKAS